MSALQKQTLSQLDCSTERYKWEGWKRREERMIYHQHLSNRNSFKLEYAARNMEDKEFSRIRDKYEFSTCKNSLRIKKSIQSYMYVKL